MAENDIKVSELTSGSVDATSAFYMAKSDNSYQVSGKNIADYSVASQTQAGLNNKTPVAAINSAISNTADAFDDTASYAVGDLCIYENALYRFTTAKSAGAWDSNKVTATTLDAEKMRHIKDLPAGSDYSPAITPTSSHLLPLSDGTNEYKASVGDVVGAYTTPVEIYSNETYSNDIGVQKTLNQDFTSFNFCRITIGKGDFNSSNRTFVLFPNLRTGTTAYLPIAFSDGVYHYVRIQLTSNNKINILSSDIPSLGLYSVVGFN